MRIEDLSVVWHLKPSTPPALFLDVLGRLLRTLPISVGQQVIRQSQFKHESLSSITEKELSADFDNSLYWSSRNSKAQLFAIYLKDRTLTHVISYTVPIHRLGSARATVSFYTDSVISLAPIYSYAKVSCSTDPPGHHIHSPEKGFSRLEWLNSFSPFYHHFLDREILYEHLPEIGDSIVVRVCETPEEYVSSAGQKIRNRIESAIDRRLFCQEYSRFSLYRLMAGVPIPNVKASITYRET